MKLSFVIPAYNEEVYLPKCLDSVVREARGHEDDVEIIVVNNASTDGTRAAAEKFPGVTIVDEPKKGLVNARRAGYMASHGEIIANVDSDTILTPGWIDKVFKEFERHKSLVCLSGPFIYYDIPRTSRFFVRIFYYITYITYIVNRFIFRVGSVVQGGNFVVRRSALEKIGGYDTSIVFYGEDTDIARRMSRVGDVKFTFSLPIFTSGRRIATEGIISTAWRYTTNYFWMTLSGHPRDIAYNDHRPDENGATLASSKKNTRQQWILGVLASVTTIIVVALIIYFIYLEVLRLSPFPWWP